MRTVLMQLCLVMIATGAVAAVEAAEQDVLGVWVTANGKSQVELTRCDAGLCGTIISLKEPLFPADDAMAGQPKVDRKNPEPGLRTRPIIGTQILNGFVYEGDNKWVDGHVYDPENGKTYKCKLTQLDAHTLEVRGYIGFALIGRTTTWTR